MTLCSNCGAENARGQKFCGECGTGLAIVCSSCGTTNAPGQKFCGECGRALANGSPAVPAPAVAPAAEGRLVSVLFLDLVGFTAASEARDAEDTRELLTSYFDLARTLIGRYGGTIEKFIGDAVMALLRPGCVPRRRPPARSAPARELGPARSPGEPPR